MSDPTLKVEASLSEGDERRSVAFARCFQGSYVRLVTALQMAGAGDAAEDIAQEAFSILFVRWKWVARDGSAAGYAYRCAFRLLAKHYRRSSAERWMELPAELVTAGPVDDDGGSIDDLLAVIDGLPLRARACATARWLTGLSTKEIAAALGIDEGTVRKHIAYARARIAEAGIVHPSP